MLNIKKDESVNEFNIVGILNEMDVKEGTSSKTNDDWISIKMDIRLDQEYDGRVEENIIPVKLFSSKHKKGTKEINNNYERFKKYADTLISLGACDEGKENMASKLSIQAKIKENSFAAQDGRFVENWELSTNFANSQKPQDKEGSSFIVTGTIVGMNKELDKDGNETGRLKIKLCLVGYNGAANVIDFVASGSPANYIENNWNEGDTVKAAGIIRSTQEVVSKEEEVGFGEPIVKNYTRTTRELVITSGSRGGLDDDSSYDADDIRTALNERKARKEEAIANASKSSSAPANKGGFGF